jgi:predicted HTH domain antitoxin
MKMITATVPDIPGLEIEYLLKIGAYHTEGEVLKDALRQFLLSRPRYRIDIAVKLYTDGKISRGKAAELAGISFDEIKDVLMQHGIKPKLGIVSIQEALDEIDVLKEIS